MTIPEESYLTGIWEVSAQDKYEAELAVRSYYASCTVCLAKKQKLPIYRICFLIILVPLLLTYISEFSQSDLSHYMAIIALVYTLPALFFVIARKDLGIPAWGSLVFLAECFRFDDWTAIISIIVPLGIMGTLAYFHERDRRFLTGQPGYPDFHAIEVRVPEERDRTEREIPPPAESPAEDPYRDILSPLQ